tara:strand:+ start:82 stop:693 length:612 start_codon:yes stop_codon:yes gene_type:complete
LIKRTSKSHIDKILSEKKNWKILDIGCGFNPNQYATTICDVLDLKEQYSDKKFVKLDGEKLPFNDKEFDFVIASHVLEHVIDPNNFLKEISRVAKQGYIEVPTKLEDNLVFENKKAHLWHLTFDDVNQVINISKKIQYFEPILAVSSIKKLNNYFRDSLVLELYWENTIEFKFNESIQQLEKLSVLSLFKKYFSKKLRILLKK